MQFNTLEFAIFFSIVYSLYLLSRHRQQNILLLIASYVFYGFWDWRFLSLIAISTIVDYFCGLAIYRENQATRRRLYLIISICTNLGLLGFFKYFNFFAGSFYELASSLGWEVDEFTLYVVLPIGISFYTFQTLSYTVDIYRREIKPTINFLNFAVFVSFFPQLVAGPIERAKNLLPQVERVRRVTQEQFYEGIWLIFFGLFKKIFIADNLAPMVNQVFSQQGSFSGGEAVVAIIAFAFQIYGDFSGYSDIARGVSKLMGFDLMLNFRMPYFSKNPSEFWRRWHISLSTWLRDYLYISLGGNRGSKLVTYRNLMLTMVLGGLWHGAAWHFILWGFYQGLLLIVHRLLRPILVLIQPKGRIATYLWNFFCIVMTFQFVCFGWLLFRAQSFDQVLNITNNIITNFSITERSIVYARDLIFYTSLLLAIQLIKEAYGDMYVVRRIPALIRGGVYLVILSFIVLAGAPGGQEFIYFQF